MKAGDEPFVDVARRRILVTGASGFIGSHLSARLRQLGGEPLTTCSPRPRKRGDGGHLVVDLLDSHALRDIVEEFRPEVVFHLAGYSHDRRSWDEPAACMRANVEGTANLVAALRRSSLHTLVHLSSAAVYGAAQSPITEQAPVEPASPYGASKLAAEHLCRLEGERNGWTVMQLRLFNTYGPGQPPDRVIPEIIVDALNGRPVRILRGGSIREFTFVDDVIRALMLAATRPGAEAEALNVGGGPAATMADLARKVLQALDDPVPLEVGDASDHVDEVRSDASLAADVLGWRATTSLDDGLAATIAWHRAAVTA